jgi:hypothetical protein
MAKMAKENIEIMKKSLLVVFLTISVGLIFLIWNENLSGNNSSNPSTNRKPAVSNQSFSITQTAIAENVAAGTDIPPQEHKNKEALSATATAVSVQTQTATPTRTPAPTRTIDPTQQWEEDQSNS